MKVLAWLRMQAAAVKASTWLFVILVAALVALAIYASTQRDARLAAERTVEAADLKAKGLLVAEDTKAAGLKADLASLQQEFAGLQAALEDARKKVGATKIVEVDKFVTVPGPVVVVPPDADGGTCALSTGDMGEIRIAELRLQTKAGNYLAVGSAEAWRVEPGPAVRLFASNFSAATSLMEVNLEAVSAKKEPGWGLGPMLIAGTGGWALGPVAATPVVDLFWGWKLEGFGGVAVGSGGNIEGAVGAIFRR